MTAWPLGEQPNETLQKLMRQLADTRRRLHATEQALLDARAAGQNAFVMAAAAHAYLAAISTDADNNDAADAWDALLAARRATTPSKTPPTHVVVAVDELERIKNEGYEAGHTDGYGSGYGDGYEYAGDGTS